MITTGGVSMGAYDTVKEVLSIAGLQGSHALGSLAGANTLAAIPAEVTSVRVGDEVSCRPPGPILEAS